jgi:hypothetical protein
MKYSTIVLLASFCTVSTFRVHFSIPNSATRIKIRTDTSLNNLHIPEVNQAGTEEYTFFAGFIDFVNQLFGPSKSAKSSVAEDKNHDAFANVIKQIAYALPAVLAPLKTPDYSKVEKLSDPVKPYYAGSFRKKNNRKHDIWNDNDMIKKFESKYVITKNALNEFIDHPDKDKSAMEYLIEIIDDVEKLGLADEIDQYFARKGIVKDLTAQLASALTTVPTAKLSNLKKLLQTELNAKAVV